MYRDLEQNWHVRLTLEVELLPLGSLTGHWWVLLGYYQALEPSVRQSLPQSLGTQRLVEASLPCPCFYPTVPNISQ